MVTRGCGGAALLAGPVSAASKEETLLAECCLKETDTDPRVIPPPKLTFPSARVHLPQNHPRQQHKSRASPPLPAPSMAPPTHPSPPQRHGFTSLGEGGWVSQNSMSRISLPGSTHAKALPPCATRRAHALYGRRDGARQVRRRSEEAGGGGEAQPVQRGVQ